MAIRAYAREIRPEDILHVAANMRASDMAEIAAAEGKEPLGALLASVAASVDTFAIDVDGVAIALAGMHPISLLAAEGSPWLLGTDEFTRHGRRATAICRAWLGRMGMQYRLMVNYADARNTRSIRWLEHLGFEFAEPEPFGVAGLPFRRFEMRT